MKVFGVLLLLVLLGACAVRARPESGPSPSPTPPTGSASPGTPAPSTAGPQPDRSDTPACAEVRAGIDDFNTGDFEGTVRHFRTAVPLAQRQADSDSSSSARDLLAAVRYYADLAPSDYLESAASSADFARYKAITLGQCVAAGTEPPDQEPSESPGVTT